MTSRSEYERLRKESHKDPRYLQSYLLMSETQYISKKTMSFTNIEEYELVFQNSIKKHKKVESDLIEEIKQKESAKGINPTAKPFIPKENPKKLFDEIVWKNEEITPEHMAQIEYEQKLAAKCNCLTYLQVECMQQIEKTGTCIYGPKKFY
jgi:hypothetical protein